MFRAVVLLLVLPSLLTPPGVCLCRCAGEGRAVPVRASRDAAPASPSREDGRRAGGCCKKCRPTPPPATAEHAALVGAGKPEADSPPDRDHAPSCPAAGLVSSKYVQAPALLLDLEPIAVGGPSDVLSDPPATRGAPADDAPRPPTPRYITFRSLLI